MPRRPPTVRVELNLPEPASKAAQHVAWAMGIEKREVLRLALAIGLHNMGGMFDVSPETHVVQPGPRPRAQVLADS